MSNTSRQSLALFLLRCIPGLVFLTEGMQKFLFPDLLGTERFEKIGFAHPAFWAYLTGSVELACGSMLILGMLVRLTAIPPLIIMAVAFVTTKWPELIDKGFWVFAHDYRTDFAMTLTLVIIILLGAGDWSMDGKRARS